MWTLWSEVPAARTMPSGGPKATLVTSAEWLIIVSGSSEPTSHTFTFLSKLAVASRLPSGLKATSVTTLAWENSWIFRFRASHSLAVLSTARCPARG